jgi:hypothetical protein
LDEVRDTIGRYTGYVERKVKGSYQEFLDSAIKEEAAFLEKIEHIRGDIERLAAFYGNTGNFSRTGEPLKVNELTLYRLEPA